MYLYVTLNWDVYKVYTYSASCEYRNKSVNTETSRLGQHKILYQLECHYLLEHFPPEDHENVID